MSTTDRCATLPDGTPIVVTFDTDGPPIDVRANGTDFGITFSYDNSVAGSVGAFQFPDNATITDLLKLRDFLNSGAVEALIAEAGRARVIAPAAA